MFGASSRSYRLEGTQAQVGPDAISTHKISHAEPFNGPMLPEVEQKRKYTPADAKAKKRQKWLVGGKSRSKMTENERVAMGAGSGSGCFGPGFD